MAVWKRLGLDNNVCVTETIVMVDKEKHRVKYYLKDYSDDMSRRPQFRVFSAGENALPDTYLVIPYDTWFGSDCKANTLTIPHDKYVEFTVYYIQQTLNRLYVANGLIQILDHDIAMSRRVITCNRYVSTDKTTQFGLAIPTDDVKWMTKNKDTLVIPTTKRTYKRSVAKPKEEASEKPQEIKTTVKKDSIFDKIKRAISN